MVGNRPRCLTYTWRYFARKSWYWPVDAQAACWGHMWLTQQTSKSSCNKVQAVGHGQLLGCTNAFKTFTNLMKCYVHENWMQLIRLARIQHTCHLAVNSQTTQTIPHLSASILCQICRNAHMLYTEAVETFCKKTLIGLGVSKTYYLDLVLSAIKTIQLVFGVWCLRRCMNQASPTPNMLQS